MIGKLFKNAGSNYANMIITMVIAFIMSPFLVHQLGDFFYGIWALVMSVCGYFSLLDLGMNRAIVRYVSLHEAQGDHRQLNRFFNTTLALFAGLGLVAALATVLLALFLEYFIDLKGNLWLGKLVVLMAGLDFAFTFPFSVLYAVLIGRQEHTIANRINISNTVLRNLVLFLALRAWPNLICLASLHVGFNLLKNLRILLVVRQHCPHIKFRISDIQRDLVPEIFRYSVHSFVVSFSSRIINFTDEIVVATFLRVGDVTYYSIATNLVTYFEKMIWAGVSVFVPFISELDAKGEGDRVKESFFSGSKFTLLLTLYIFSGIYLLGGDFVGIWMGEKYAKVVEPVLLVLALAKVICIGQSMAVARFFGTSRHHLLSRLNLAEAVTNLVLSIVLVRSYGMLGVAIGTLIPSFICNGVLLPLVIFREFQISWLDYFTKSLGGPLAVCAGCILLLRQAEIHAQSYPALLLWGGALTLLFALLSLGLVFTGTERRYLCTKVRFNHGN